MLNLTSKEKKLLLLLGTLLLFGLFLRFYYQEKDSFMVRDSSWKEGVIDHETGLQEEKGETLPFQAEKVIIVHVTGAVANPGVYTLEEGSRVFHVVEKAGGQLENADLERINLAQPLYDGQPVFIPRIGEGNASPDEGLLPAGDSSAVKVNINTASKAQLETLPGIGNVKAQNIINYRQEHGPFQSIEDLINVHGIGEKILAGMKDFITIY